MRTLVIAAPPRDESSTRRRLFPNVYPKPLSRGSIVKVPLLFSASSPEIFGIWKSGRVVIASITCLSLLLGDLLRVQLDDELLFDGGGDLAPLREPQHLGGERVVIGLQPRRDPRGELGGAANDVRHSAGRLDRDHVLRLHLKRGDVHSPAVHRPMPVADQLSRLAP